MRIAVTGGSGYVGRLVALHALDQGHDVVVLDRADPPDDLAGRVDHRRVDMADVAAVRTAVAGCQALVHLAGIPAPDLAPDHVVHHTNVVASYTALGVAAVTGIRRVVQASSINAIGASWSRRPRFDGFPVDTGHPTYAEDAYSLSKWIAEQQADAMVRRHEALSVASLRFHRVVPDRATAAALTVPDGGARAVRGLWGYTTERMAAWAAVRACTADLTGHEVLWVVAPDTLSDVPSATLAATHYPDVPLRRPLVGREAFFDTTRTAELLGADPGLRLRVGERVVIKGRSVTVTPTAFDCLPRVRARLVDAARVGETVTYGELREELGLPYLVQGMGRLLDLLSEDCARRGEPSLASLVVNASTGEVGADFDGDPGPERAAVFRHRGWSRP